MQNEKKNIDGKSGLPDRLLDFETMGNHLGISKRQVYRLIAEGILPQAVKVGRRSRLFESDITAFKELIKSKRNTFGVFEKEAA